MELFEKKLTDLRLSTEQIKTQSLQELYESLRSVENAIQQPESLGKIEIDHHDTKWGRISDVVVDVTSEITPILYERKRQIINRMIVLTGEKGIEAVRDLLGKNKTGVEEEVQNQISERIDELESKLRDLQRQDSEAEVAQREAEKRHEEHELQIKVENARVERLERRTKVWLSMIERESVATIVGALLLLIIVFLQAVILIFGVEMPEMLNNAFLVILGYFFGQATLRKSSSE
jgi:Skp family chaperone for outer membrane proteins